MKRLIYWIGWLTDSVSTIGAWLVVPLFLIMGYEVFARFVLDLPTFWSYELAYMITGGHFVLGIAYVTKTRQHIRIDFIYSHLSPRAQAAIDFIVYAGFLLPLTAWITWRLGIVAIEAYQVGEVSGESVWNPVVWPLRTVVTFGFGLFCLQILVETVRSFRSAFARLPEES